MAASVEQIKSIAELGAEVLMVQLNLASKNPADALLENWPLGYCFGAFDVLAAKAGFDPYTDGMTVMAVGFSLLAGRDAGTSFLGKALDRQAEQAFSEGRQYGGNDIFEWLRGEGFKPLFLMNYFSRAAGSLLLTGLPVG